MASEICERADRLHQFRVAVDLEQVGAHVDAAEHADEQVVVRRIVAGILERVPGTLEEDPLLRIEDLRVPRAEPEEGRVEEVDAFERHAFVHEARMAHHGRIDAGRGQVLGGETPHRLHAVLQVLPELRDIRRIRHAAAHADYGDGCGFVVVVHAQLLWLPP